MATPTIPVSSYFTAPRQAGIDWSGIMSILNSINSSKPRQAQPSAPAAPTSPPATPPATPDASSQIQGIQPGTLTSMLGSNFFGWPQTISWPKVPTIQAPTLS